MFSAEPFMASTRRLKGADLLSSPDRFSPTTCKIIKLHKKIAQEMRSSPTDIYNFIIDSLCCHQTHVIEPLLWSIATESVAYVSPLSGDSRQNNENPKTYRPSSPHQTTTLKMPQRKCPPAAALLTLNTQPPKDQMLHV
jgi:hypothetical protein